MPPVFPDDVQPVQVDNAGFFNQTKAHSFSVQAASSKYIRRHSIGSSSISSRVRALSQSAIVLVDGLPHYLKNINKHELQESDAPDF